MINLNEKKKITDIIYTVDSYENTSMINLNENKKNRHYTLLPNAHAKLNFCLFVILCTRSLWMKCMHVLKSYIADATLAHSDN